MGMYDLYSKVGKYLKADKKNKDPLNVVIVSPSSRSASSGLSGDVSRTYGNQEDVQAPAGVVHGQEGVINARAMQNLGQDTFTALTHKAEDGTLDLNKIRSAVGLAALPGYADGGVVDPQGSAPATGATTPTATSSTTTSTAGTAPVTALLTPDNQDTWFNQNVQGGGYNDTLAAGLAANPAIMVDPGTGKIVYKDPTQNNITANSDPTIWTPGTAVTAENQSSYYTQQGQGSVPSSVAISDAQATNPTATVNPTTGQVTDSTTPTTGYVAPASTLNDATRSASNQYLTDVMNNNNPLQKNIANQTLNDLSARQQYGNAANQQTMAQNPNLTQGGINTLNAETAATNSANLATTEGTLATNAQNQAITAANTLYSGSLQGQYEDLASQAQAFNQKQTLLGNQWTNYNAALAAGNYDTAAAVYKSATGQTLDVTQYKLDLANSKLSTDMTNVTSYAKLYGTGGVQSMITDMESRGLLDPNDTARINTLTTAYNGAIDATNPVKVAENYFNNLSDNEVQNLVSGDSTYAGMSPAQIRSKLTEISIMGATPTATVTDYGNSAASPVSIPNLNQYTMNGTSKAFVNPPSSGQYFSYGGKTYQRIGSIDDTGLVEHFTAIDETTGQQVIIQAGTGPAGVPSIGTTPIPTGFGIGTNVSTGTTATGDDVAQTVSA